jgi:hypothetical protein
MLVLAFPSRTSADASRTITHESTSDALSQAESDPVTKNGDSPSDDEVSIEAIETESADTLSSRKEVPWLGISTAEASEALASQLDLQPGGGLIVTYLAPDGPAAKAGLKKNDVLVQFEDQSLVHPAQLRKLVRVHKEGDAVKCVFYRSGKKQTVSVTLEKTAAPAAFEQEGDLPRHLHMLNRHLKDLHIDDTVRNQMDTLRESLGNMKLDLQIDQKKLKNQIRHSMEQTRNAIEESLRNVTNTDVALSTVRKALEHLSGPGVLIGNKANVTVRSSGKGVKSLVNTDDSGTIVLVNKPKLRLTAHDKDGKLLFDGEIESEDQRSKVPPEVWQRVEPLLEKMGETATEEPESKDEQ